jgi:hypothetical protein
MPNFFSLSEALDALIDYTMQSEFDYVINEIKEHSSFEDWSLFVLSETAYGAANIVAFQNVSDSEMLRDLRELWEAHS